MFAFTARSNPDLSLFTFKIKNITKCKKESYGTRETEFLILFFLQITRASCLGSLETVGIVDDCPVSEEEWKKAAVMKNCSAYASQCDKPDRFVYHCVINTFLNETLEVCAYGKTILLGKNQFRMLKCLRSIRDHWNILYYILESRTQIPKTTLTQCHRVVKEITKSGLVLLLLSNIRKETLKI